MEKKNVAVIFGGRTTEHDVAVITGVQFMENMNKEKYNIIPVFIDGNGVWYTGDVLFDINSYKHFEDVKSKLTEVYISPIPNINALLNANPKMFGKKEVAKIDVAVISIHGMNGEDGTVQGLLELANIPYVSSGVLGSALGMDKIAMKAVFKGNDLPILKYEYFLKSEWQKNKDEIIKHLESSLKYPMFVKPANLGSSIGISKAKDTDGLIKAIEIATGYDKRIIVEEGVENLVEINCSALGYDDNIETSVCEEPTNWEEFLTFEDKYIRSNAKTGSSKTGSGKQGMAQMDRKIPADLPEDLTKRIQELTRLAFKHLNCSGVARVDFIIDKNTMTPYINEINTIPGSFSFYLWQYTDLKYPELIDRLILNAEKIYKEKNENVYSFTSTIMNNVGKSAKLNK